MTLTKTHARAVLKSVRSLKRRRPTKRRRSLERGAAAATTVANEAEAAPAAMTAQTMKSAAKSQRSIAKREEAPHQTTGATVVSAHTADKRNLSVHVARTIAGELIKIYKI